MGGAERGCRSKLEKGLESSLVGASGYIKGGATISSSGGLIYTLL